MSLKDSIELGQLRDGYPALASWIARDPDGDGYIFRKFDPLAARNALHLQAQLVALEHEIDQIDESARQSKDDATMLASRRWETLIEQAELTNSPQCARLEKLDEISEILKKYCKLRSCQLLAAEC